MNMQRNRSNIHSIHIFSFDTQAVEDPAFSLKVSRDWKAGPGSSRFPIILWEN